MPSLSLIRPKIDEALEIELRCQLHSSGTAKQARSNIPERRTGDSSNWNVERRMIRQILRFHPHLKVHPLCELEPLTERQVELEERRPNQEIPARVANRAWRGDGELTRRQCGRVEALADLTTAQVVKHSSVRVALQLPHVATAPAAISR